MNMMPNDLTQILRNDFPSFLLKVFQELNPGTDYSHNWHIDLMAAYLEQCRQGECRRLIINVPPRHLKSITVSIANVAWLLGQNPALNIICVSYGQELATKLALDCRRVMQCDWYRQLFPGTVISAEKNTQTDFMTTVGGGRMSTSIGGVLTGRGADVIIIDDPLKPDEALSDSSRKNVNYWFDGTLLSRLNDKLHGRIILVMQRLHEEDLSGYLLAKGGYTHLTLPALAIESEEYEIKTAFGAYRHCRSPGDALHPSREPAALLAAIKKDTGDYNFMGQYQQQPTPVGGVLIQRSWFKTYFEQPSDLSSIFFSVDSASKESELNDYSVCLVFGVKGKALYLLHVMRERLNYPDLKRKIELLDQQFDPAKILIEDKSSGIQLIQEFHQEGLHKVQGCKTLGDKFMRMHAQTGLIENGFFYLPSEAYWLDDYANELIKFPRGKHDDQVDATSQALAWFQTGQSFYGSNLTLYYEGCQLFDEEDDRRRRCGERPMTDAEEQDVRHSATLDMAHQRYLRTIASQSVQARNFPGFD